MAAKRPSNSSMFHGGLFLRLLLVVLVSANAASAGSIVEYLPGYGNLTFKLETGYVSVGDSELFYYFIESQGNPQTDPFFLWLTGGPGCSSFNGLIYEIGPMEFDIHNYPGGLPRLLPYKYAWTKTASILFLDAPVGTGFSYSTSADGWSSSDTDSALETYEFLRKWLIEHPKYLPLQLYVGGDSYSGIIVPLVVKHIVDAIDEHTVPRFNLQGYLVGSPTTDENINTNAKVVFAHRLALISDELYEAAKENCNGNYADVDPSNTKCLSSLGEIQHCVKDLFRNDILEPKCVFESPEPTRRSLDEKPGDFILNTPKLEEFWCRNFNYALSYIWANDESVQEALNVRVGTVKYWSRCNKSLSYTKDVQSVIDVHRYLSKKQLEVLVEVGDRDLVVPYPGAVEWIRLLNLTIVSPWRPWFVDGEIAGYTEKHSQNGYRLTYATGAGHTAPEYYRRECYYMFKRWVHYYPL
ncbi:Serine carboxypeptidase-like 18 [Vitis vinifera]|uniref:Serine carboxypeptidase-like 18 n=1 Tax=Vitis vinifera TaxID=29760 RepID=A0A438JMF3_VITVI|nr:Serine carboxypeptidase-like 18 [Vitis vinifera]